MRTAARYHREHRRISAGIVGEWARAGLDLDRASQFAQVAREIVYLHGVSAGVMGIWCASTVGQPSPLFLNHMKRNRMEFQARCLKLEQFPLELSNEEVAALAKTHSGPVRGFSDYYGSSYTALSENLRYWTIDNLSGELLYMPQDQGLIEGLSISESWKSDIYWASQYGQWLSNNPIWDIYGYGPSVNERYLEGVFSESDSDEGEEVSHGEGAREFSLHDHLSRLPLAAFKLLHGRVGHGKVSYDEIIACVYKGKTREPETIQKLLQRMQSKVEEHSPGRWHLEIEHSDRRAWLTPLSSPRFGRNPDKF